MIIINELRNEWYDNGSTDQVYIWLIRIYLNRDVLNFLIVIYKWVNKRRNNTERKKEINKWKKTKLMKAYHTNEI